MGRPRTKVDYKLLLMKYMKYVKEDKGTYLLRNRILVDYFEPHEHMALDVMANTLDNLEGIER